VIVGSVKSEDMTIAFIFLVACHAVIEDTLYLFHWESRFCRIIHYRIEDGGRVYLEPG
jgi:hypothetical protein